MASSECNEVVSVFIKLLCVWTFCDLDREATRHFVIMPASLKTFNFYFLRNCELSSSNVYLLLLITEVV